MNRFRILHEDETTVAIDKPAGFYVHPPEGGALRIPRSLNCLRLLRHQLGQEIYPVHRIDRATSGVLLFAKNSARASTLCAAFREGSVEKSYVAVVRGHCAPQGEWTQEIGGKPAHTLYFTLAHAELPHAVGRYATARYSLVKLFPKTGRQHQLRVHCSKANHPIIGDSVYGDRRHNRFFRETLGLPGLYLKAFTLRWPDAPGPGLHSARAKWDHRWHEAFEFFKVCAT